MPDCNNYLTVQGEREEVQRFKEKAVGHSPWRRPPKDKKPNVLNFHSLVPIPEEVLQQGYHLAGFKWECENWSCKWGAIEAELVIHNSCELFYSFETHFGPPLALLEHLGVLWPNLTFFLEFDNDPQPVHPGVERLLEMICGEWPKFELGPGQRFKGICKVHGDQHEYRSIKS